MYSKSAYLKAPVVLAAIAIALAAALLCGAQPAYADSVQYVEKSWDGTEKKVVSETKTAECAPITKDTENIQGWYYVSGTIEGSKRLTVMEGQEANIILTDGSKLTLEKGINVYWSSKLNIYAQQGETGELVCYADTSKENAPIGSDNNSGPNGPITIHGGKITANNDNNEAHAAGIGAGKTGAGGTITIYGGTIEARGGNGSAGIGGGDAYGPGRDGGTITIYGGDVKAYGGGGAAGIGGSRGGNGGVITIWGGKVYAKGGPQSSYSFPNDSGAGIGSGDDDAGSTATTGGTISIYGGEVEAYGGPDAAGIGGGDGCIGGNITIAGGTVKASSNGCASGIGAGDDTDGRVNASIINITGGTIEATGGKHGAGIGGGEGGGGGIINISGGAVTASAGSDGAGIGGGKGGNGDTVTISGGTVVATGNAGGAGIGGGDGGAGTNIIISGGHVDATGGANGAGIGNGEDGTGLATTITLRYAEDEYDINVKATSYRCNNEDTSVTLTMENPFTDKGTREAFAATSYTAANLDTLNNKTLVRASTFGITVSEAQGGSVVVGKSRAVPGSTVTLTVAPDADGWELKPGTLKAKAGETELALTQDTSDSSKYTFTMPAADVAVTAEFELKVSVGSISISPTSTTLAVDGTETLTVTVSPEDANTSALADTLTWTSGDAGVATVDASGKVTGIAPGAATITVTTDNGTEDKADDKTATCAVTVTKAEVAAPTIASKVYNGEAQVAEVPASDFYTVTKNDGGTNAGEYDVVLTLKDATKYKWADSDDAAKTLKFNITKAENIVSVSLQSWVSGEQAKTPIVTASYGAERATFGYKAKNAEDSAYSTGVPTVAGAYTVRAAIAESDNYLAGSATDDFIIGDGGVTLTLIGSSIDTDVGDPYVLTVAKGSTVEDLANPNDEAAYNALLARFTKDEYAPYNRVFHVTSKPLKEYGGWGAVEAENLTCSASPLTENTTYYVPLWKAIDSVELTAQLPACGTDMATSKPVVTTADSSLVKVAAWGPEWWDVASDKEVESGTIVGGNSYGVRADLNAEFGYYFREGDNAPTISVANADDGSASLFTVDTIAKATFTVTAKHDFSTYVASGNAITSACSGCREQATLTIGAPTLTTYGQTGEDMSAEATITDASGIRGDRPVSYYKANNDGTRGEALAGAPTDAGKYWAEITLGEGESAATAHVIYEIAAADISQATVTLAQTSYVYDGKAKEPAAKVTMGGRELVSGTDYDVSYVDNVDVGTATVTVTGKGNYVGSAEATFAIADEAKPGPMPEPAKGALHRLYNPNSGEHFFTASAYERDAVVAAGWTYEGEGWTAPETGDPVYRLYNPNAGEHHYTRSAEERDMLIATGWNDEGVGWFSDEAETVPLYRVYNPNAFANNHHYTASAAERDWLVGLGWQDEGIAWYGL